MNRITPAIRDLAQRLLSYEAPVGRSPDTSGAAVFNVCEKLRRPLSTLAGPIGFQSLLFRALTMARAETPSLRAFGVNERGSLEILPEAGSKTQKIDGRRAEAETDPEAGVLLIAQLLGLLHAFIGEALTLRLIQDVWPQESAGSKHNGTIEHRKDNNA